MAPAILLGIIACYVGGYGWLLLGVDNLSLTLSQLDTTHMVGFIAGFIAQTHLGVSLRVRDQPGCPHPCGTRVGRAEEA